MRIRMLCAVALASLPVSAIAAIAPGSASAAVTLPPALQALEEKMQQLQVTTERFTTNYELGTPKGGGATFGLTYGFSGEAVLSPLTAKLTLNVANKHTPERLIGETLYVYEPRLSKLDKGRPWVRIEHESLQKVIQFDPSGAVQGASNGATGAFANLLSIINGALTIKEVGPATVDKQAVTEFSATLNPQVLIGVFTKQEFEELEFFGKPSLDLHVYLSAIGVPVRTQLVFNVKGIEAGASVDILSINEPVSVAAPPANLTISKALRKKLGKQEDAAKLRASQRKKAAEEAKKAKHAKRQHKKSKAKK